jgi:hypothetical protein
LYIKRESNFGGIIKRVDLLSISSAVMVADGCVTVGWFFNNIFGSRNDCVVYEFDYLLIRLVAGAFEVGVERSVNQAQLVFFIILSCVQGIQSESFGLFWLDRIRW